MYDSRAYNCLHFARDVWLDLTDVDIVDLLHGLFLPGRRVQKVHLHSFRERLAPADPSLVLMQRPGGDPHIGVYVDGNLLHITESGVEYLPVEVAARGFRTVRYFLPC